MKSKRVFLIILDSFGIGAMPDAADFGDHDCNTLKRIAQSPNFKCDNLAKAGLGRIDGVDCIHEYENSENMPAAAVGRLSEKSRGKDTTVGHWEIAGIISESPFPTYPQGFPKYLIDKLSEATGRGILCNKPYSGTEVIRDYGKEHIETGKLIVYTSADSVCQIAAHEDIVPVEKLYSYCMAAREIFQGKDAVGRIIARPFTGTCGNFVRTSNRRDFSLEPTAPTVLDAIKSAGKSVIAVGKIKDIFAGRGITDFYPTHSNKEGMDTAENILTEDFEGLCFINLVDFDMLYGHRQDIDGYASAMSEFDRRLPVLIQNMKDGDILMISADHGCDPGDSHTDHTREYVPLLVFGKEIKPVNLGTRSTFSDIAASIAEYLGIDFKCAGKSFIKEIM